MVFQLSSILDQQKHLSVLSHWNSARHWSNILELCAFLQDSWKMDRQIQAWQGEFRQWCSACTAVLSRRFFRTSSKIDNIILAIASSDGALHLEHDRHLKIVCRPSWTRSWIWWLFLRDDYQQNMSGENFESLKSNPDDFRWRYSTEWDVSSPLFTGIRAAEIQTLKAQTVQSAGQVMAFAFWEAHGIVLVNYNYLSKELTIKQHASPLTY